MKLVSEELPPTEVEILCWDERRGFKIGYLFRNRGGATGQFWCVGGVSGGIGTPREVKAPTHWQELPPEPIPAMTYTNHRIPGTENNNSRHAGHYITEIRYWIPERTEDEPLITGDGFYFYDEVEQIGGGPYPTKEKALEERNKYCATL